MHGFPGYAPGLPLPTTVQILNGQSPVNSPAVVSEAKPGERWSYSGGGYVVVQLLMTDTTGKAFPDLMRDLVLRPAHMTSSTYEQPLPPALGPRAATGYRADGQPLPGGRNVYRGWAEAALWTTSTDLARFAIALQNAHAGSSQAILTKPTASGHADPAIEQLRAGALPRRPRASGEPPSFGHGGDNGGFHAELRAFTGGSRQVGVMTNGDGGPLLIADILRAVSNTYGWGDTKPREMEVIKLAPEQLVALTGSTDPRGHQAHRHRRGRPALCDGARPGPGPARTAAANGRQVLHPRQRRHRRVREGCRRRGEQGGDRQPLRRLQARRAP